MIDATYQVSALAKSGASPETIMFRFTEMLNNGSDNSVPENFIWFSNWLKSNTHGQMYTSDVVWPSFDDFVKAINRGHMIVAGLDDYVNLRLINGQKPWPWNDPHGLGHVLVVIGYDTSSGALVVHDPLRADPSGMPADYSWTSFQAAQCHDLIEVIGPSLSAGGLSEGGSGLGNGLGMLAGWLQIVAAFLVAVFQLIQSYFTTGRLT